MMNEVIVLKMSSAYNPTLYKKFKSVIYQHKNIPNLLKNIRYTFQQLSKLLSKNVNGEKNICSHQNI